MITHWTTLAACLLASLACLRAALKTMPLRAGAMPYRMDPRVWVLLAIVWAEFALIKIAAGSTTLCESIRSEAISHGWYDERRLWQLGAVVLITLATLTPVLVLLFKPVFSHWHRYRVPLSAVILVAGFALVRFVSYHYIDQLGITLTAMKTVVEAGAALVTLRTALAWSPQRVRLR